MSHIPFPPPEDVGVLAVGHGAAWFKPNMLIVVVPTTDLGRSCRTRLFNTPDQMGPKPVISFLCEDTAYVGGWSERWLEDTLKTAMLYIGYFPADSSPSASWLETELLTERFEMRLGERRERETIAVIEDGYINAAELRKKCREAGIPVRDRLDGMRPELGLRAEPLEAKLAEDLKNIWARVLRGGK